MKKCGKHYKESLMEQIDILLEKIEKQYGVYIGKKSLSRLSTFLSGYECALEDLTGSRPYFNARFQTFIEKKEGKEFCTEHWSVILSEGRSDEDAFDKFFHYWTEMRQSEIQ